MTQPGYHDLAPLNISCVTLSRHRCLDIEASSTELLDRLVYGQLNFGCVNSCITPGGGTDLTNVAYRHKHPGVACDLFIMKLKVSGGLPITV